MNAIEAMHYTMFPRPSRMVATPVNDIDVERLNFEGGETAPCTTMAINEKVLPPPLGRRGSCTSVIYLNTG